MKGVCVIKVTIEGPGETFGSITKIIIDELIKAGAKVKVIDKYPNPGNKEAQLKNEIEIHTKHSPWGG